MKLLILPRKNNMNYYETSARKNIDVMKFYKGLIEKIYNTADLDADDEKHGIRKGMVSSLQSTNKR